MGTSRSFTGCPTFILVLRRSAKLMGENGKLNDVWYTMCAWYDTTGRTQGRQSVLFSTLIISVSKSLYQTCHFIEYGYSAAPHLRATIPSAFAIGSRWNVIYSSLVFLGSGLMSFGPDELIIYHN